MTKKLGNLSDDCGIKQNLEQKQNLEFTNKLKEKIGDQLFEVFGFGDENSIRNLLELTLDGIDLPYYFDKACMDFDRFNALVPIEFSQGVVVDEKLFLWYLSVSLCLMKQEKIEIINSAKTLSQKQVIDLLSIFREEQIKFYKLFKKKPHSLIEILSLYEINFVSWKEIVEELNSVVKNDL